MVTVLQWTACWMLHHVLQHMEMGTLSSLQYNFWGFIFKSGNPTQHSEMCNKKPINYQLHISECNQSRCGTVRSPCLAIFEMTFIFCSGVGGNSSFCVCQFEVCLHFYSFSMLSPHQEWCIVCMRTCELEFSGHIRWDVLFFSCFLHKSTRWRHHQYTTRHLVSVCSTSSHQDVDKACVPVLDGNILNYFQLCPAPHIWHVYTLL